MTGLRDYVPVPGAWHLRLGPVRIMHYPALDLPFRILPMKVPGRQITFGKTSVQIVWYWFGFGKDGGS